MKWIGPDRDREGGFTLIELAIVLALIGLVGGGAFMSYDAIRAKNDISATNISLDRIESALTLFVAEQGRLPCPATSNDGVEVTPPCASRYGLVPWSTLGLPRADAVDGWNNMISYAVTDTLADDTDPPPMECDSTNTNIMGAAVGDLAACYGADDYGGCTGEKMAFAVISHGKNGLGATTVGGAARANPTTPAECLNAGLATTCSGTNPTEFRVEPRSGTATTFDDIVRARPATRVMADGGCRWQRPDYSTGVLAASLSSISNGQVTIANSNGADAIQLVKASDGTAFADSEHGAGNVNFGDVTGTTDPNDPVSDLGGTRTASCLWFNEVIAFTTQRLSIYLEGQMGQGETNIDEPNGTADGFTMIIVPGTTTLTSTSCGADSGEGMAYDNTGNAFSLTSPDGLYPLGDGANKMAIEFDNWSSNGSDPHLNHVAILRGDSANHSATIASASSYYDAAPGCPSSSSTVAVNGAADWGCTVRREEAAWMDIRRSTTSTAPSYTVDQPAPFTARVDMTRQCNQGCTSCSAGAGNYMKIKVWADCPDADLCRAISIDHSTLLNTPLAITEASVNNFSEVTAVAQADPNAATLAIETTSGTYDPAAAGFQVGDYVRFTSGATTAEFTVAAISGNVMTASYGQTQLPTGTYATFTLTRLVNTISACMLEPNASASGHNASSNFNTVKIGLGVSNGLNFAFRLLDLRAQSY